MRVASSYSLGGRGTLTSSEVNHGDNGEKGKGLFTHCFEIFIAM